MPGISRIAVARGMLARFNEDIKYPATLLVTLTLALTAAAGGDFGQTLTPEEMRAAGLAKLTPEELARLETLVQRYKAGDSAATPTAPQAQQGLPAAKSAKLLPAWVGALLTLERTGSRPDKTDVMESRLKGNFSGWSGRTSFRLDNGQLWSQVNGESYLYAPTLKTPKVKIYPASFGTFWLEIEGVNERCRVKPVKLE
jgi:hypothetical protein